MEEIKIYNDELSAGRDVSTLSNPLVEKLFVYLRQDIFRHDPPACFASDASISKIMFDYSEKKGLENILNEKICNGLDDKLNP